MPNNTAASDAHGLIRGLANAATSTMADSVNSTIIMRMIMSRFHTSAWWLRSSIAYCTPMLVRMSAHAMWYCFWYPNQSSLVASPTKYIRYMLINRHT